MAVRLGLTGFWVRYADGRTRRFSWLWLLPVLSVPLVLLLGLAFQSQPIVRYYVNRAMREPAYLGSAVRVFLHVNRTSLENLVLAQPEPLRSELPTLHLDLGNNTISDMMKALALGDPALDHEPGGDKPWFPGQYTDEGGQPRRVQVCIRGANVWHHRPEKPSLRLRIRQEDQTDRRFVELSRPEDVLAMKNWLPDRLGRRQGMLSDLGDHVRLVLNGKFMGVYLRTMRAEEPLALLNGRMPGTFFKGDLLSQAERAGGPLWDGLPRWSLDGEVDDGFNLGVFQRFLHLATALTPAPALVAAGDPQGVAAARLEALGEVLDLELYARWAALMIATCSVHTEEWHNHTYFVTTYQGQVEAVPWDVNGYGVHVPPSVPPDVLLHPPMLAISRDPRWVHRRNLALWGLLQGDCHPDRLLAEIDAELARMLPDLRADENLSTFEWTHVGLIELPWSVAAIEPKRAELEAFVRARHALLAAYLADARVSVGPDPERPGASRVVVWGSAAVRVARDDGGPLATDAWGGEPDLLHPGLSEALEDFTEFTYERGGRHPFARPAPLVYRVDAPPERLRFVNAVTGAAVAPGPEATAPLPARSVHPGRFSVPAREDVVLGPGELRLDRDLTTAPGQRLLIRPGTRLLLAPGVGIYARGQVLAEGTAEAPIELRPSGAEPWGAFGVMGPGADISRFRHVRVQGGSVGERFSRWKGQFNVYGRPGREGQGEVLLQDCWFGRSFVGDDSVNLAEVDARVERCAWEDARSDALDLDMCRVRVRDCRWTNSGNDGLDNMTCDTDVRDCVFVGSGDKAISMGEASRITVQRCQMLSCARGIELKDATRAVVFDSVFRGCGVTVNSYQKKAWYGRGGLGALVRCRLEESRELDVKLAPRCDLTLVETEAARVDASPDRVRRAPSLGPEWEDLLRRARDWAREKD